MFESPSMAAGAGHNKQNNKHGDDMGIKRREFLASVGSLAGLAAMPAVAGTAAAKAGGQGGAPLYKQASAPVEARVEDLLRRMTLEEKVAQMECLWIKKGEIQNSDTSFSPEKASKAWPNGIGMFARPSDRQLGAASAAGHSGAVQHRGPRETA